MKKLLALAFMLTGCGTTLALPEQYRPLVQVEESPGKVQAHGVTTTVGATCYVTSLVEWSAAYPDKSVVRDALLQHERVHSLRQGSSPALEVWLGRYLVEPSFRWREEQAGWRAEIYHLVAGGIYVDADRIAGILNGPTYQLPGQGRMVSYVDAVTFVRKTVQDAISGVPE